MMKFSLVLISASLLSACATTKSQEDVAPAADNTQIEVSGNYDAFIERYSAGDTEYAGVYNNFEFKATLLNSEIRRGLQWKRAKYFEWSETQKATEREKSNQEMSSETKVVMAFFTPNSKNDNFNDEKSIWRIYLDSNGHRYEGKAKKLRMLLVELQALYPYMSRWPTPYEVTFTVPTSAIESSPSMFTVTGPLGSRSVIFPALH